MIVQKNLDDGPKVLLYDCKLHLFLGKLLSRWTGPFIVNYVFPHGAVEISDTKSREVLKVNGYRLKPFSENYQPELESVDLDKPKYPVV